MASNVVHRGSSATDRTTASSTNAASNGDLKPCYELHRAVFHGEETRVKELLAIKLNPNAQDKHGNTPLHIAVMLGHKNIIHELLRYGAVVKEKNSLGWTPLDESISYGDRSTISLLLKNLRDQTTAGLIQRRHSLVQSLQKLDDFYAELKWEFHTWVPLLSRLLPSDVCKIYKTGTCIRLDSTLGDFTEMRWSRGDLSFIFNGEDHQNNNTLSMVVLDNQTKVYQRMKLLGSEDVHADLHDHVNLMMTKPIIYANMSTRPITITRAQSGWIFRTDKSERVGAYDTDVYNITNLILVSRRRREHLTPEQIKEHEDIQKKVETGNLGENDFGKGGEGDGEEDEEGDEERETVQSLPPPPPTNVTWEDYINAPDGQAPHLGRAMDLKIERKHYKAAVSMTEQCPIEMMKLLDILEVIAPYKHFHKLRQFVDMKLPQGFPVKLDIPVFPTVTAMITLERYEQRETPVSKYLIPRDYTKYVPKKGKDSSPSSKSGAEAAGATASNS